MPFAKYSVAYPAALKVSATVISSPIIPSVLFIISMELKTLVAANGETVFTVGKITLSAPPLYGCLPVKAAKRDGEQTEYPE